MLPDHERPVGRSRIVDLTIPIADGMDAFPGEPTARFSPFSTHADGGIEMWNINLFSQLGTHVDAPVHFLPDGATNERLLLESMVGPVTVIDVVAREGGFLAAVDLEDHLASIRQTRRVILRSGWDVRRGSSGYWQGFTEITPDAARLLVDTGVRFLGIDTPTPSFTDLHEVHRILLGAGCVIAECLVNTAELSAVSFIVCLPLPLVGVDGAPARIIALEPEHDRP